MDNLIDKSDTCFIVRYGAIFAGVKVKEELGMEGQGSDFLLYSRPILMLFHNTN